MSEGFGTVVSMSIKRFVGPVVLVVLLAACGGGGDEAAADTTVPLTLPSTSSTTSTTTTTTTTSEAPATTAESTTTTVAVVDESGIELTWAEEGTVEADVERAFWPALQISREVYEENVVDPNYPQFLAAFTGRALERNQAELADFAAAGDFFRYPEESETQVQFIVLVSPTEALVQVCEIDRGALYRAGVLSDDQDLESEFQARFVLEDEVWLWEQTQTTTFEPLEGELPTCWESSDT